MYTIMSGLGKCHFQYQLKYCSIYTVTSRVHGVHLCKGSQCSLNVTTVHGKVAEWTPMGFTAEIIDLKQQSISGRWCCICLETLFELHKTMPVNAHGSKACVHFVDEQIFKTLMPFWEYSKDASCIQCELLYPNVISLESQINKVVYILCPLKVWTSLLLSVIFL